jgi:nucleotide-binding universal stress UspA family protein
LKRQASKVNKEDAMYNTLLVPLDGSQRAERILPHAEALAQKFGAQLVLLQVVEPIISTVVSDDLLPFYDTKMVNGLMWNASVSGTWKRQRCTHTLTFGLKLYEPTQKNIKDQREHLTQNLRF